MISNKTLIICLVLLKIVHIQSLIKLPLVEDNDIKNVEAAIRNTVNNIFENFNIEYTKDDSKLEQYSTIHNFFVSTTLHDRDNLKEIGRLTQVNNVDNNTHDFITEINEVLDDDDKSNEDSHNNSIHVTSYINTFIRKLRYLKDKYVTDENTAISPGILKYLDNTESSLINTKRDSNTVTSQKVVSDNNYWHSSARRIYHGKRTKIKDFPFIASIQYLMKFHCAGSIIKDDLVITSSSCLQLTWNNRFFRENPAFLSVQVGSDFYNGAGGENIAVQEIYFHPSYDPKTLKNNLAILRLIRKIKFKRSRRVRKIDFDRNPWQLPKNSGRVTLVGWGAKDSSNIVYNVFKNRLSYSDLKIYPHNECQDFFSEKVVTNTNFCVGSSTKASGACSFDAGGPGVIQNILIGVISFGSSFCGVPDSPTVLTKLGHYTDWIETIMEQEVPHQKMETTIAVPKLMPIKLTTNISSFTPIIGSSPLPMEPLDLQNQLRLGRNEDELFKEFLEVLHGSEEHSKESNKKTSKQINSLNAHNEKEKTTAIKEIKLEISTDFPSTLGLIYNLNVNSAEDFYNKKKTPYIQTLKDNVKKLLLRPEKLDRKIRDFVATNNYTGIMDRINAVVKEQFLTNKLNIERKNKNTQLETTVKQQRYILKKMK